MPASVSKLFSFLLAKNKKNKHGQKDNQFLNSSTKIMTSFVLFIINLYHCNWQLRLISQAHKVPDFFLNYLM